MTRNIIWDAEYKLLSKYIVLSSWSFRFCFKNVIMWFLKKFSFRCFFLLISNFTISVFSDVSFELVENFRISRECSRMWVCVCVCLFLCVHVFKQYHSYGFIYMFTLRIAHNCWDSVPGLWASLASTVPLSNISNHQVFPVYVCICSLVFKNCVVVFVNL